jgi:hypothetical protein
LMMKAKPIVLVIITLIIGFVLGMLTSAQIRFHKLKPVRVFFSEQRFREGFYRTIEPNDQQKVKIDLILDKYAKINSDFQDDFRKNLDSTMKEFRKELGSNLTKEQLERLKKMDDRRQEMIRQNRRNNQHPDSLRNRDERQDDHNMRPFHEGNSPSPGKPPFPRPDTARLPDSK